MTMTSEDISNLVGDIYEAAHGQMEWLDVVQRVGRLFSSSRACLALYSADPAQTRILANDLDEKTTAKFYDYGPSNEWLDGFNAAAFGQVYNDHAMSGHDRLRKSAVWNEWFRPQDMYGSLSCKLLHLDGSTWFFDMQRGRRQPSFDARDIEALQLIVPHLIRAARISERLSLTRSLATSFQSLPYGSVVTDGQGRVVSLNPAAEAILDQASGLIAIKAGHFVASTSEGQLRLQRLIADACGSGDPTPGTGGEMIVKAAGDGGEIAKLIVSITPLKRIRILGSLDRRYAAIFLRRICLSLPAGFVDRLRDAFDLSPAEAKLAAALARGVSLRAAAEEAGISFGTARRYLERIFQKTRTRQQSQLVALLKTTTPLVA